MESSIIISISILLLLAYVFDITAAKTKIPAVILLLILGFLVKQITDLVGLNIPDLTQVLPVLGTVGLILIVLEGSLELELNKSKFGLVGKSFAVAFIPLLVFSFGLAYAFQYFGGGTFKITLANAIPFAIISSAIAIPSAKNLSSRNKEFITYESSLSDIIGVVFFNFITLNSYIGSQSVGQFVGQLSIMLLITVIATLGMSLLLSQIKHHVKYAPIILMIILIYTISKDYHLPALIFILLFGIFMGNLDEIRQVKFINWLHPEIMDKEVFKLKELTTEVAFLIRSLFFLLFGYLIQASELLNSSTILWALGIVCGIFTLRVFMLLIMKLPIFPLLFIAPRGLITILLFLSIPAVQGIALANKSLIIQVIILTSLAMMLGLMISKKDIKKRIIAEENKDDNLA